jgi:hypothetical protein
MRTVWKRALGYSLLSVYFLVFMEWLFFITKPSFFSALNAQQSLTVLFVTPLPYVCIVQATFLVLLPFDIARART